MQDCSAAAENILLSAPAVGLGAVWVGVYPISSIMARIVKIFTLPEGVRPLCVIYVGYPDEQKPARTQYNPHRVYWESYEPRKRQLKKKNAKYS